MFKNLIRFQLGPLLSSALMELLKELKTSKDRKLPILDATCPLVAKVHKEGQRYSSKGYEVILIGHEGHPEVEGNGRISETFILFQTLKMFLNLMKNPKKLSYIVKPLSLWMTPR